MQAVDTVEADCVEHRHMCGRCGRVLADAERRCFVCGADLMTMADCVMEEEDAEIVE